MPLTAVAGRSAPTTQVSAHLVSPPITYIYTRPTLASRFDPAEQESRARLAAEQAELAVKTVSREANLTARQRRTGLPRRAALIARAGAGTVILISELAVLGRGLADLVAVLADAQDRGLTILLAGDDGNVHPPTMRDLDEARRGYARESVLEGRARARLRGVRFGRPPVPAAKVEAVRAGIKQGLGLRAAARAAGVGVATASRIRDVEAA